jgi:hypothetical protein
LNVVPPGIVASTCVPSIVNVCVTESMFWIVIEDADFAAKQFGWNARPWIVTVKGSSPVRSTAVAAVHPEPVAPEAAVVAPLGEPPVSELLLLQAAPVSAVTAAMAMNTLRMPRLP